MYSDSSTFDLIYELGRLNIDELQEYYSQSTIRALQLAAMDLLEDNTFEINSINDFALYIQILDEAKTRGARQLGDAIIKSSNFSEKGRIDEAIRILDDFIISCPSAYYKEIAKVHKDNIINK